MTSKPHDSDVEQDDTASDDPVGAEVGMAEGEGSTFEPEEDPEGHSG